VRPVRVVFPGSGGGACLNERKDARFVSGIPGNEDGKGTEKKEGKDKLREVAW